MRKAFSILLLLLSVASTAQFSQTQQPEIDSLNHLLSIEKKDTSRVLLLLELSSRYEDTNPDTALKLANEGLVLANQIGYLKGEYYSKGRLAAIWYQMGEYSAAIKVALEILKSAEATKDIEMIGYARGFLISSYRDQGEYAEALKYALHALELQQRYFNCEMCGAVYPALASIYYDMGMLDSAKWYYNQYYRYKKLPWMTGWIYQLGGRIHAKAGEMDSAFKYFKLAIGRLPRDNNVKDLAGTYVDVAMLYQQQGKLDSALVNGHRGYAIARGSSLNKEALQASLFLSKAYEGKNSDSALFYYKQAMGVKETLFSQEKAKQLLSFRFNEERDRREEERKEEQDKNRIKVGVLLGSVGLLTFIAFIQYRSNKHRQRINGLLESKNRQIENTLTELKATQSQLIQGEKMASLGELTAGIAHEIQNPLNFVNNFSEVSIEQVDDLENAAISGEKEEVASIASNLRENLQKVVNHGKRADAIVKGMLQHSRTSSGQRQPTDINKLVDEYLRLSYHGFRAKDKNFNAAFETHLDASMDKINIIPQDIGRVLLNLFNNAFYAVAEKKKGVRDEYEPTVSVSTKKANNKVVITVTDNGNGIPQNLVDKIFQPFFTTKPTGQGTGLGLSLSCDIVKAHGGDVKVSSNDGAGAEFIIHLPIAISSFNS